MFGKTWIVASVLVWGALIGSTATLALELKVVRDAKNKFRDQAIQLQIDKGKLEENLRLAVDSAKGKDELIEAFQGTFTKIREDQVKAAKKVDEALAKIQESANGNAKRSNQILAALPQSNDLCEAANLLINQYLAEVQGEKK